MLLIVVLFYQLIGLTIKYPKVEHIASYCINIYIYISLYITISRILCVVTALRIVPPSDPSLPEPPPRSKGAVELRRAPRCPRTWPLRLRRAPPKAPEGQRGRERRLRQVASRQPVSVCVCVISWVVMCVGNLQKSRCSNVFCSHCFVAWESNDTDLTKHQTETFEEPRPVSCVSGGCAGGGRGGGWLGWEGASWPLLALETRRRRRDPTKS